MDFETLYDAWERYNDLLKRCPHHGLPLWLQVQTFYNGVNPSTRQLIDAAAGGTLNNKTLEEAYEFIEEMSLNNYQWQVMRIKPTKAAGVFNLDTVTMLSNQVELLNKKIDDLYGFTQVRGTIPTSREVAKEIKGHNIPQNIETTLKNQQASIQGLETQIGQLTKLISEQPQGSLPSNTKSNPREQLNAITIRDEKGLVEPKLEPRQGIMMPNAIQFLKELLANKRKLDEASHVELNAVCSVILQNKLPKKLKDPGSFTIPCLIGSLNVNNALADLGASINVMPYKMFKQLDMEEDSDVPLILGRPFLATARTIIDVGTGELILRESPRKNVMEPYSNPCHKNRATHEERRLQINELDEW
ncbi:hypothetical protein CXB51_019760 [Gossypium anomalum]|uniref:Retrotransposon gag domain-containing protein n=1 Tax=Gossypium anomalum TaxID=47600 RepID=A0A8J5ZE85_9ROSI|nr:hypothetical protein CXB51_019760 [Gossypium anomalum]